MTKIGEIKNNLQQSEVIGLVYDKTELKSYGNGDGKYIHYFLSDDTAKIKLTLFGENAKKFEDLQSNKKYRFQNVYGKQANVNYPCINSNMMELMAMSTFNVVVNDEVDEILDLNLTVSTISDTDSIEKGLKEYCMINAPKATFEFQSQKKFFMECINCHFALDMEPEKFCCRNCNKIYSFEDELNFSMRVKISPSKKNAEKKKVPEELEKKQKEEPKKNEIAGEDIEVADVPQKRLRGCAKDLVVKVKKEKEEVDVKPKSAQKRKVARK